MDRIAVKTGAGSTAAGKDNGSNGTGSGGRRSSSGIWMREIFANVTVIVLLILAMEVWSRYVPPFIMPAPAKTLDAMIEAVRNDYVHIGLTIGRLCIAVLAALLIGTLIGALMALVRPLEPFLRSIVVIDTGVPALSWMLFAIFWFENAESRVFFILLMILVPFYALNVFDGIRALSKDLVEMVETFRPSRWQVLRLLIWPHIVPYLLMTTKSIIGYATRMTVFAELVSVSTGMGAKMGAAQSTFQMDGVLAWTIILVLANLVIQAIVMGLERMLLGYRPEVEVR
jgi:NitT/TauT family transport system permease protein